ncbi:hypothetical protein ELH91_10245 [Rhizobium leguminosarum]|uniref:hypothetical protein n=1 Tax=Rhizobium leguminosarum TaxID=384 RepID=UPI00102FDF9A|nr:hypothetical protein [Rhizobium leguminosarum]TAY17120.1 hypothetical protein ELH91_10245 [Rhizobium leguminosarum]
MKLLLKQYLASLRERDELDVVLPDVLSAIGFTIISRPMRGTSQFGVDAVAIGPHFRTGKKALHLLSIKSGNLTRAQWDDGKQALRPSLAEILDVYIETRIPPRHKDLPIVIALCFGGDIQEDVRAQVKGFTDRNSIEGKLEFAEWNGDEIAGFMLSGLLREKLFPKPMQGSFRKALAFVDEPDVCVAHFTALLSQILSAANDDHQSRIRSARQIYLAAWNVFVWARDAENLDAAYRAGALSLLWMWSLCREHVVGGKRAKELATVVENMISLFRLAAHAYFEQHVLPYADIEDGLGVSVRPSDSVDVNLRLFEALGRVAVHGLWLLQLRERLTASGDDGIPEIDEELRKTLDVITSTVSNNHVFCEPLRDDHAIEIMLVGVFLVQCGLSEYFADWIEEVIGSSTYSYRTNGHYPCILRDYADLAAHPKDVEGYREEVTAGSILYPTLAVWLAVLERDDAVVELGAFREKHMPHSTFQLWVPDETSEQHLYRNSAAHGTGIAELALDDPKKLLASVIKEITEAPEFFELSAVKFGLWPLVLTACQSHRIPVPIHFWRR